jgi:hypothetical protein
MAKNKKSHERSRQAKIMRQRARARERQRSAAPVEAMDEFQMFRADLLPPDVDPAEWTRTRILEDLSGLRPRQALPQFLSTFVDPAAVEEDDESEAKRQIEWGLFLWQLALLDPGEREETIQKVSESTVPESERRAEFREFVRDVIRTHEEMFPRLHAHVARARGKPRTDLPEESILTDLPPTEEEIEALADARAAEAGLPPANRFVEYARPLITAAGSDRKALERAFTLAAICWAAASMPLEERAGFLADERERFEADAEQAWFDETVPMMLRRHRELFPSTPAAQPHEPRSVTPAEAARPAELVSEASEADRGAAEGGEEQPTQEEIGEPSAAEEAAESGVPAQTAEEKPSLLGRLFRRGG